MFNKNFNFNKNYQETISDEIRNLLNDTGIGLSSEECNYLEIWKKKILDLSGNN